MEHILELFYDLPRGKVHGLDTPFTRTARMKSETMEMLSATMTEQQKELLECYFDADAKIEGMIQFEHFRYAFHLGAQLMEELIEGKKEIL